MRRTALLLIVLPALGCEAWPNPSSSAIAIDGGPITDGTTGGASNNAGSSPPSSTMSTANSDAGQGSGTSLYNGLPPISPNGDSVVVGTRGGHIQFPGGFTLDIPSGALESDITIQADTVAVPPEMLGMGSPAAPIIELLPNGLSFKVPARLQTVMPAMGVNNIVAVSSEPDAPSLEDIAIAQGDGDTLDAFIWHFSYYGVFGTDWGDLTVGDLTACDTAPVRGLSLQIERIFQQLAPGSIAPLDDARVGSSDPLGRPFLQGAVSAAIEAALNDPAAATTRVPFQITSGWRSLAQQYVLSNCSNGNATAPPGTSNHADGSAFDLAGSYPNAAACYAANTSLVQSGDFSAVRDLSHPFWGAQLEKGGTFLWFGSEAKTNICGDPPHFDETSGQSDELRTTATLAFQTLWNNNNPCDQIDATGQFDADTESSLNVSPAGGFGGISPIQLPAEGAGCPPVTSSMATTCCPGSGGAKPSCADRQTDPNHCGECERVCPSFQICQSGGCVCATSGQVVCGDACVDELTDSDNCGACGNTCSGGESCVGGRCQCPTGQVFCGGSCLDPSTYQSEPNNCGGCGSVCPSTESCNGGQCRPNICGKCPTGYDVTERGFEDGSNTPIFACCLVILTGQCVDYFYNTQTGVHVPYSSQCSTIQDPEGIDTNGQCAGNSACGIPEGGTFQEDMVCKDDATCIIP